MKLPLDVVERICAIFTPKEAAQVIQILDEWDSYLLQYPRSIVYLSNGDFQKFVELNEEGKRDPRDIIYEAEGAAGHYGHWFALTFPEIEELEKAMAKEFNRLAKEEETQTFPDDFWNYLL